MATSVMSNPNSPTSMRLRMTYSVSAGSFVLTKLEGCRTDAYGSQSTRTSNRIHVSVAGSSVTFTAIDNKIEFPKNSAYRAMWTGSQSWSCSGNVAIKVTFTSTLANIKNASFSTTVNVPVPFTNPWWTTYSVSSFPSTAYANMPFYYNVNLGCNFGSSGSNNLLYWEGYNSSKYITTVSTTGTGIGSGQRSYTFGTGDIGSYTFRGVIRYTNSGGGTSYNVHGTTYPLTVSWSNPAISGVTNRLNSTSFYRTSTVTSTFSGNVSSNSSSPGIYTYFSDTADATGDSGAGHYHVKSYSPANWDTISNVSKSYTHRGDRPGTFYSEIILNGGNAAGQWVNFAKYGHVEYTMHEFVAPTAPRTITYNKHNIYVGQTKFPITVKVSSTSKSQYDTLTPTFSTGTCKNGHWSYDSGALGTHNFAAGTYNMVLNKVNDPYVAGDVASFCDEMVYRNALNSNVYAQLDSTGYTVKEVPTPIDDEVRITTSYDEATNTITATMRNNFDTDFIVNYSLYLKNGDGTVTYEQINGTFNDTYKEITFNYKPDAPNTYKVDMAINYSLAWETNVSGNSATFSSNSVDVTFTKLCVEKGGNIGRIYLFENNACSKPRLAVKYGNTIKYIPLHTDTSANVDKLQVKTDSTNYYIIINTYSADNIPTQADLETYNHSYLENYTYKQIINNLKEN